jgi:hypothetical protein
MPGTTLSCPARSWPNAAAAAGTLAGTSAPTGLIPLAGRLARKAKDRGASTNGTTGLRSYGGN